MIDRKAEYERIGAERALAERESRRIMWRELLLTMLKIVAWCLLGLFIMFWGFAVNDLQIGKAFYWGGQAVGYAGIAYTIFSAYKRGEERGDW